MATNKGYRVGILFALTTTVGLGLVGFVDKLGSLKTTNPFVFSTQSVFFSLIFTLIFSLFYFELSRERKYPGLQSGKVYLKNSYIHKIKTLSLTSWLQIIIVGTFASGFFILFRFLGLQHTTGTFASLSQGVTTSLTAIMAYFFLKEKLSRKFWILFLIIIISIYFNSVGRFAFVSMNVGDLLILCGTIFLAIGNIFSKVAVKNVSPIMLSTGRFLFGFVFLSLVGIIFVGSSADFYHAGIFAVASGLLWSVMIIAFNLAIQRIGVAFTTSLLMTGPVITMVLESILLHKSFTNVQITAAIVIIVSGILIVRLNEPRKN